MLTTASKIALDAGRFLRDHFGQSQSITETSAHDVKLQIDIDCQHLIEERLTKAFPSHAIVGEEGNCGNLEAEYRWVIDPLDGTVNYTYGIPHFCVSMALQRQNPMAHLATALGGYEIILGIVYDPMRDELFTAEKGKGAFLNRNRLHVSKRSSLEEAIIIVGFSKSAETIEHGLHHFQRLIRQARKIRMMGAAALDLAYVASGRIEAYWELKVRLWDIAAGVLMVEEAGGVVQLEQLTGVPFLFKALASNGKVQLGN